MKNKTLSLIFCIFTVLMTAVCSTPILQAKCSGYTVSEAESLADGIVSYEMGKAGAESIQDWINGELTAGAGDSSEWTILTLSQSGYDSCDYSSYEKALLSFLSGDQVISPTSREKYALALCAAGSRDGYISRTLSDSVGEQGIMSWIYGLHIINNGYTSPEYNAESVCGELLSLQYPDGGWALFGQYGDIDVTAMTVQALAPYYSSDTAVKNAIDRALSFMSEKQESDGGFVSFGTANPESASQVLVALSALGIDCQTDNRFIKNGNTVIDGIVKFRLPDGSFSHTLGGAQNNTATFQVHYAIVSYVRLKQGKGPLLILDNRSTKPVVQPETTAPHTENTTKHSEPHSESGNSNVPEPSQSNESGGGSSPEVTTPPEQFPSPEVTDDISITPDTPDASAPVYTQPVPANRQVTTSSTVTTSAETSTASGSSGTITSVSTSVTVASSISGTTEASGTVIAPGSDDTQSGGKKGSYKPIAIVIILSLTAALSGVIFAMGKRSYKNFIALGAASAVMIAFVLLTDFRSADDYYNGEKIHKENAIGTVTMTIRCDTIAGKTESDFIPEDGIILDETEFDLEEGETVFDILTEASRTYKIQVENKGSAGGAHGMVYIAGINYIYEMDFGDLSGWVYHVNGITPSRGCGEYELSPDDRIEWLYTCELGKDLDEVYEQ